MPASNDLIAGTTMSEHTQPSHTREETIWDQPTRLFHWILVASLLCCVLTGYFLEDWFLPLHVFGGSVVAWLLLFRLIWGVKGSSYSRFKSFPLSLKENRAHLASLLKGKSIPFTGHTPLGSWMILVMLSGLALMIISGFLTYGAQENLGILAPLTNIKDAHFFKEIHKTISALLLIAIGLHVSAVLLETFVFKHPLIKSMITGKKPTSETAAPVSRKSNHLGLALFTLSGALMIAGLYSFNDQRQPLASNILYQKECADCHMAYPATLHTSESWLKLMSDLENHFGEDASLADAKVKAITPYLQANSAEHSKTEAAYYIGLRPTASLEITETKYWKKRHKRLSERDFKNPAVQSKANCKACHLDAQTGFFDDANIQLPKGL